MTRRSGAALLLAALVGTGCGMLRPRPADPLNAEEHNDLGVAYYARGEYRLAAREFRRAVSAGRAWARALVNLGDAELALGNVDAAIEAYQAGLRASPDDTGAANNLAWALLQHPERWREAEPVIRGALARDPEPRPYYLDTLGLLLLRKGEPHEALVTFRAALASAALRDGATRALVLRHAGEALATLGEVAAAERCRRLAGELGGERSAGPVLMEQEPAPKAVGETDTVC